MFPRRMLHALLSKLMAVFHSLVSKLKTTKNDATATAASTNIPLVVEKTWLRIQEIDADDILPEDSISNVDHEDAKRALADIDDIRPEDSISNVEKPGFVFAAEQNTLSTKDDTNSSVDGAQFEGGSADLDGSSEDMSDAWTLQKERHFSNVGHSIGSAERF
eukprot:TRINITY_DN8071_c1_g1_i2.p1 TRINITY_DN8071_c1_g1~~TRINITY_DN8071_c1_g1_i2.p1  ORF type:complete len:162 (+),score=31.20 TRINITY_DN8071_c1_g1_i2:71-556(+)